MIVVRQPPPAPRRPPPRRSGGCGLILLLALVGTVGISVWLRSPRADVTIVGAAAMIIRAEAQHPGTAAGEIGSTAPAEQPYGNPLASSQTVMTQGYGVGTHAPAAVWGAVDLAIDGNGDGFADPDASMDTPIHATHAGHVRCTPNSYPAGNHVWVENDAYRTGYAHLNRFADECDTTVARGTVIGYLGSTGMSSGPHLDYQVWALHDGAWVNQNPLDFAALN